ncbi:glycosyltransferase family 1 protein [Methylobacterium sp. WL6]|uniref:glycosyltransferase family 4 protein n=1 Tax=Methylobacterium sp. WL6 TaxID=2603901 RepID=UPI0011CB8567|nr:glycosyltransferase family 1 protein [Methylobacterium sp. WL6]TXN69684.1 glycosyltransferase family 4 protein [Methylobacterium sp. WL6]
MKVVIDVSTALRWVNNNAVGIVRTEREIARFFIQHHCNTDLIYYDRDEQDFRRVSQQQIVALFPDLEAFVPDPSDLISSTNAFYSFSSKSVLISAGLQWDIDFFGVVYNKKKLINFKVIQVVYDIIPIIMPEYCVPGMDILFPKFIVDTIWTADAIFAISESTKKDLIAFADKLKCRYTGPIYTLRLGCDIPSSSFTTDIQLGLRKDGFVLYISTIEPRKNHRLLFDIWRSFDESEYDSVPKLVFVGNKGWNTENFVISIENCVRLYPEKIVLLNNVSDSNLEWLYNNAMFSVYPSLYEGWGLPIAESLARGTPCIASNSSSMPEAAGSFCDLLDPFDYTGWKKTIKKYLADPELRSEKSKYIKSNYNVQTWYSAMLSFKHDVDGLLVEWDF